MNPFETQQKCFHTIGLSRERSKPHKPFRSKARDAQVYFRAEFFGFENTARDGDGARVIDR